MAAQKNLPVAHVFAKPAELDRPNELGRLKCRLDIVRRILSEVSDQQRAAANKRIFAFLLGECLIRRLIRLRRSVDKLIVARPERKLIHQVLRLDQITRRMSRAFDTFVFQVKRNFGRAVTFVRNQK